MGDLIRIYDYAWCDDNDAIVLWAPYEAAVKMIDSEVLDEEYDGDAELALEDAADTEHDGYVVARGEEIPRDVVVVGDPDKIAREYSDAILGCSDTLAAWATERRITVEQARVLLQI